MRSLILGGLLAFRLVPIFAADEGCHLALQREIRRFMKTRIPLNPHLAQRFIQQLKVFYPKGIPSETTYVLGTLYNVYADRTGLTDIARNSSALSAIARLSYADQLGYFSLLFHHPLLLTERAPMGGRALFTDFSPHWLPGDQRETLIEILSGFQIPDYIVSLIKEDPLVPADLIGALSVSFYSGNKTWRFTVRFLNETSYRLEQDGRIIAQGGWGLSDGVVYLEGQAGYEFHFEDATWFSLRKKYAQLTRIQAGHALGLMIVRLDPASPL